MKTTLLSLLFCFTFITAKSVAEVHWVTSFEEGKRIAQKENKLMLVDFWAWWCGPCKKMDSDVWSEEDIVELAQNFVPVKVDIDVDKATASKYGARAIPTIIVMDPYGKPIFENTGYMHYSLVKDLLESFPADIGKYKEEMSRYKEDYKNPEVNFELGLALQQLALESGETAKISFLYKSDDCFRDAEKFASKEDMAALAGKAELMQYLNKSYWGKPKKAIKQFEKKKGMDAVMEENMPLAYYFLYESFLVMQNDKKARKYYSSLKEIDEGGRWITLADDKIKDRP